MKTPKYLKGNIVNIIIIIAISAIYFNADARAFLIRGLMMTGLFNAKADIEAPKNIFPEAMIFKSEEGEIINTADKSGKIYFINFWATWCPPCRAEMPSINSLARKLKNKGNIEFIMVDVDAQLESSKSYMKKNNFNLKVYTFESRIPENIFSGTLPTTAIIGPDGSLIFHHTGMADYDNQKMIDFLNNLK